MGEFTDHHSAIFVRWICKQVFSNGYVSAYPNDFYTNTTQVTIHSKQFRNIIHAHPTKYVPIQPKFHPTTPPIGLDIPRSTLLQRIFTQSYDFHCLCGTACIFIQHVTAHLFLSLYVLCTVAMLVATARHDRPMDAVCLRCLSSRMQTSSSSSRCSSIVLYYVRLVRICVASVFGPFRFRWCVNDGVLAVFVVRLSSGGGGFGFWVECACCLLHVSCCAVPSTLLMLQIHTHSLTNIVVRCFCVLRV